MEYKPGDTVITLAEVGDIPLGCVGKVKSRNYFTCTVEFSFSHSICTESYYSDQLGSFNKNTSVQEDQWDENLRGKKMSNNTGKVIYKYQMPVKEKFTMKLPKDAQILRVADQDGMFWLWAVVDTRKPDEERHFVAIKCGVNVPEDKILNYIGMCAIFVQQELALYIFEDQGDF